MGEGDGRPTSITLKEALPAEVPVSAAFVLAVRVSSPSSGAQAGAAQRGVVTVMAGEDTVATREVLVRGEGEDFSDAETFALRAPEQLGACAWTVVFPRQEIDGVVYEQSALPIAFRTRPQATSLAVWDIPSPVVMGERFTVKVGAKSTADGQLEGARIDIADEAGAVVGSGTLGKEPWPGTTALYWTEVALTAPAGERIWSWSARFAADGLALPHDGASGAFSFSTTLPPEHLVEVVAVVRDTLVPVSDAVVRLGPHRGVTDEAGVVRLRVPTGTYEVVVWKALYQTVPTTVDVARDVAIRVEGKQLPPKIYMGIE